MASGHPPPAVLILFLGGLAAWPGMLPAQRAEVPALDTAEPPAATGSHVVREQETLEGIAAYYLGSARRWPEIWELNNERIRHPDLIYPGTKLDIALPTHLPPRAARIAAYRRRVEEERAPLPAERVAVNDLLKPLDVVQTYDGASAELRFGDQTRLIVTEQSRVILGEAPRDLPPVERRQIEIVVGQADLESRPRSGSELDIEIVMGSAVVTPRPTDGGETVQARTRRSGGDGAQLMVYAGTSGIESGGARLEVAEGMGTSVAGGGPPAPPEKLLEAPGVSAPAPGARLAEADPLFAWRPVAGSESYTVEICHDRSCGELERRATELAETSWRAGQLPVGTYFWRVTARSVSGLDGFPSVPAELTILAEEVDRAAPLASVAFSGPMVGVSDRLVLGIGAEVRAEVSDEGKGLAEWQRLLDGETVTEEGWKSASWTPGPHTVSVAAVDRAGNRTVLEPRPFVYDPDPPVIRWGFEDGPDVGRASGRPASEAGPLAEKGEPGIWSRIVGSDLSPLTWTSSEVKWLPMGYGEWKISSDKPQIAIRARAKSVTLTTIGVTVSRDRGLRIQASDAGCGVESMSYRLLVGPDGELTLVLSAVDALDNETRVAWRLVRD